MGFSLGHDGCWDCLLSRGETFRLHYKMLFLGPMSLQTFEVMATSAGRMHPAERAWDSESGRLPLNTGFTIYLYLWNFGKITSFSVNSVFWKYYFEPHVSNTSIPSNDSKSREGACSRKIIRFGVRMSAFEHHLLSMPLGGNHYSFCKMRLILNTKPLAVFWGLNEYMLVKKIVNGKVF